MTDPNWWHVGASLAGGGAAGAVFSNIVAAYRSRRQPVGYRVEVVPVFTGTLGASSMVASLSITDGHDVVELSNLFVFKLQVVNKGNRDIDEFAAGFELPPHEQAIYVEGEPPSRHHSFSLTNKVTPGDPNDCFDFCLKPFNRADLYTLNAFVVTTDGHTPSGAIEPTSPQPVRFVGMPTIAELALEAAQGTSVKIGPLKVGIYG